MGRVRIARGLGVPLKIALLAIGLLGTAADAAVTVLGVQYQQDDWFPEFNCIWKDKYYPTSCPVGTAVGSNIHAYLKNTGGGSVTVTSVQLEGYDLATVLKENEGVHNARSIYFYWDNPPQDILDAGEPVWYKVDPSVTIPAGGVAQVVVRLRQVPVTNPVGLSIVTSGGTVNPSIAISATAPQLASVGFSQDRKKVYLHWRRNGGAAPTSVFMDGTDVTANATTVGDSSVNYAATVLSFATALNPMSYHVYQGVYADGKTATASLRTWVNKFIHGTYGNFALSSSYTAGDWIDEASDHGINNVQVSVGEIGGYMATGAGEAHALARGFGYTSGDKTKFVADIDPDMFFINDEIDAEESNMERTFCGTGLKLPCGKSPMGILAARSIAEGETLRALRPMTPTSINMNGSFKPENYYAYGQAVDILQVDPYYQRRLQDAYWRDQNVIPVYEKATYIYAVSKAVARAAEPNPSNVILYECSWKCPDENACDAQYVGDIWPYADPETKRIEAYYSLAAGTKGLCYWWMNASGWPAHGLADQSTQAARDLWKEMGLYGAEIKTIAPQLVISHPVDMALAPSTNVWARSLASGTDTIILLAVNDDYYNDTAGFHHNVVNNASVVATLPSWMTSSPSAFEVRTSGLYDVSTSLNGSQLTVSLGTLNITRMIVITTNPQLRATVQQRYEQEVWPGVCNFAPEQCVPQTSAPSITQHPSNQTVAPGDTATFMVVAAGSSPLSYQWQKNGVNVTNGGHYAGCTTATLTISSVDSGDATNYRCVVTNSHGTATSNAATLSLGTPVGPTITQDPSNQSVTPGGTVAFSVTATGSGTLSYQWQKNQTNLTNGGHYAGCTTANLTISSADSNDAASYRCVVTNPYGNDTSNEASLTIATCSTPTVVNGDFEGGNTGGIGTGWTGYTRPTVPSFVGYTIQNASPPEGLQFQQIQSSYVASGGAGVYQVVTGCTSGASYRIQGSFRTNSASGRATVKCAPNGSTSYSSAIDLTPAASTTSSTWSTFDGTVTATASSITLFLDCQTHVVVTGDGKAAAFDNVTVTCVSTSSAPTITQHPTAQSVCSGGTATFTVAATGSGTLTYQWQKNSVNVTNGGHYAGCTTSTLTVSSANSGDVAGYRCVVTNSSGSTNSNAANLTLKSATAISQHPQNQSVASNATATFTVAATGDGTLTYQWQKNSVNVTNGGHYAGCTTATLIISNADSNDVASYRCVVTGGCGNTTSNQATLTVGAAVVPGDFDADGDIDLTDFAQLQNCLTGSDLPVTDPVCLETDLTSDGFVDQTDVSRFVGCMSGAGIPANAGCVSP